MSENVFLTANLSLRLGDLQVLDGVGFPVVKGEVTAILGPNGAGKTTLARALCRIISGWSGQILFQDRRLESWKRNEFARKVAYLPQFPAVNFPFTVREVVLMGRIPHQQNRFFETARDHQVVQEALCLTGVEHLAARYFNELSGGERQLAALAGALAQEPEVLVLDEPTVFLDLKHQLQIGTVLSNLHRERKVTIVLVTHDLNLAEGFCDRLVLLRKGRLMADLDNSRRSALTAELIREVFEVQAVEVEREWSKRILLSFKREN